MNVIFISKVDLNVFNIISHKISQVILPQAVQYSRVAGVGDDVQVSRLRRARYELHAREVLVSVAHRFQHTELERFN